MAKPFKPGHQVSAKELNDAAEQSRRAAGARGGGLTGGFRQTPAGLSFFPIEERPFWARLDDGPDEDTGAYAWTEMQDEIQDDDTIEYIEITDGRTGTIDPFVNPLYEVNHITAPLTITGEDDEERPTIVRVWPALSGQIYVFEWGGGGGACADCPELPEGWTETTDCVLQIEGSTCNVETNEVTNTTTVICLPTPVRIQTTSTVSDLPECPQGDPGADGADGADGANAVVTTTSADSLSVSVGSKSFSTALAMTVGVGTPLMIARTSDPTGKWMLGQVTSISTTSVVVSVVITSAATGTHSDWDVTVAGINQVSCVEVIDPASLTLTGTATLDPMTCELDLSGITIDFDSVYLRGLFTVSSTPC